MLTNLGSDLHHMVDLDLLDKNSIIIDAGASDGRFVKAFRKMCDCFIYAMEPRFDNYMKILGHNFKNIDVVRAALVQETYRGFYTNFNHYEGGGGKYFQWGSTCTIHEDEIERRSKREEILVTNYRVPARRLGYIIKRFDKIDYLKMDIEGAELPVIKSITDKPEIYKNIKQISLEYHYPDIDRMVGMLEGMGFKTTVEGNEIYGLQSSAV